MSVGRCHLLPHGYACGEHLSPEQAATSPFSLCCCRAQPEESLQPPFRQQGTVVTWKLARSEILKRSLMHYTGSKKTNAQSFTWYSKAFPTQLFTVSSEIQNPLIHHSSSPKSLRIFCHKGKFSSSVSSHTPKEALLPTGKGTSS